MRAFFLKNMMKTPNESQRQIIDDLQNNLIVFASAGTGKTFTVANRVANVLRSQKATAEEILCLTFTIKACNEMREDIRFQLGGAESVQVATIHGFCYRLLMEERKRTGGAFADVGVCDEVDQEEILRSILSSRLSYWKMEDALTAQGLPLPVWEECSVFERNGEYLWLVQERLINERGELFALEEGIAPAQAFCPYCKELRSLENGKCSACGKELSLRPQKNEFDLYRRRGALRNFASALKHYREENDLYSQNAEGDYQRALDLLKESSPKEYEGLISHYAQYLGHSPDEEFERAMSTYAGRLLAEYDAHLALSNLLDFDDLIIQANAVLRTEEGLSYWSKKYKYIILDEMQDTSLLEYSVLKKLFAENNVMLCGDFFQTIYGWRGSRPSEVLEGYIQDFSAKIYMLSENYRATKTLAQATFGYLQNIYPQWVGKYCPSALNIHSEREGEKIFCYAFDNREQEAAQIYRYLLRAKREASADICIIARSNKYIAQLARYFEKFSLEQESELRFFTVEENFQFFKKPLVKDVLAVFKLLVNPDDRVSMERLTEKYVRNVGIKTIEALRQYNPLGVSIVSFLDRQTYESGDPYHRLLEALHQDNLVIYDTETTGLDLQSDQAVQISAVKINRLGEVLATLDIMIEPTVPISEAAYATHGFNLEYIRTHGGTTVTEALERFSKFVKGSVLVGHNNLGYDKPLIERQLKENGLPALEVLAEYDTLLLAKQFYPRLVNFKLSTLCERFGVMNECAHNALGDIKATGECLVKMLTESVLPTALERRTVLAKYTDKFQKIHDFMQELAVALEKGEELAPSIVERLGLAKRYPSLSDAATLRDLLESLKTERTDKTAFLKEYLKDAALSGSQMDILIQKSKRIPIITVHQAKGCEFDTVILAGVDDSNFPSYAAKQSGLEEEEKKVFYVAITRAKEKLILTRALKNGRYEVNESPYVWALPEKYVRMNRAWKNGN